MDSVASTSRDTKHGKAVKRGQDRARAAGVRIGRPPNPSLTPDVIERALTMRAARVPIRVIAALLHVPRSTLHRALRVELPVRAVKLAQRQASR